MKTEHRLGRRRFLATASALGTAGATVACDLLLDPDTQPQTNPGLEILLETPATIDPALVTLPQEFTIAHAIFEPLITVGDDTHPHPAVAESWQITDGGRAYTFKIRSNAKWTNGEAVTADDFVWAWQRNLDPSVGGAFNYLMFPIIGAEDFALGRTRNRSVVDVTAPDPSTLRFRLVQPTPGFLARLATPTFFPLPRVEIEAMRGLWTSPSNIRSNGPYRLVGWNGESGMTLIPNEHHWDFRDIPARFSIRFADDDQSGLSEFQSGTVDAVELRGDGYRAARAEPRLVERLRLFDLATSWLVVINTRKPPWNQAALRQALSLALDRESLISMVFEKPTLPAWRITPPAILGRPRETLAPDVDRARQILVNAGYPNGEGLASATFTFHRSPTWERLATALAERWRDTLGLTVVPDQREWRDFLSFTDNPGDFDMYRGGWSSEYRDPANWYDDLWHSGRDYLRAHWSNTAFDVQLGAAASARNPAGRVAAYAAADQILETELPAIPIGYRASAILLQPHVTQFRVDPITGAIDLAASRSAT